MSEAAWLVLARLARLRPPRRTRGPRTARRRWSSPASSPTTAPPWSFAARWPRPAGGSTRGSCGWNMGARADTIERLKQRLDRIFARTSRCWSSAGASAASSPASSPAPIRTGSAPSSPSARPFSGDPRQNNVWRLYEWVAGHPVDQPPIERICDKPPVPCLAIWSRQRRHHRPRAPPAACPRKATRPSSSTATIWPSEYRAGPRKRWCSEIDSFLKSLG